MVATDDTGIDGEEPHCRSEQTGLQHARSETHAATGPPVETTLTAQSPISEEKPWLLDIMESINVNEVVGHFSQFDEEIGSEGDEDDELDGCEPFLVASDVS
jgi:hypothetical protein